VNGKIAPKSNVIGVADPIAQRGRRNRWPRQRERPAVLPGFVPPACNQRGQREQGRSIRFKRKLVRPAKPMRREGPDDRMEVRLADSTLRSGEPATWGSGQRWLDCSWATWAPYNGRHGLLFNEKISRPWKTKLEQIAAKAVKQRPKSVGAGNPHATFCGNRGRVTASGDPVGVETELWPTH
jgi:hypothetical protein